jgi:hypothetical protein
MNGIESMSKQELVEMIFLSTKELDMLLAELSILPSKSSADNLLKSIADCFIKRNLAYYLLKGEKEFKEFLKTDTLNQLVVSVLEDKNEAGIAAEGGSNNV